MMSSRDVPRTGIVVEDASAAITLAEAVVANQDLWEELDELSGYHRVARIHVRGHSGHVDQERCDALAAEAAREARKESNTGSEARSPLPY